MYEEINSRLDDIERKINNLESHHIEPWAWILMVVVGIEVFSIIAAIDTDHMKFSIPKQLPITEKTSILSDGSVKFNIIYDENFSGNVWFNREENKIEFYLKNESKKSYWLDDIKPYLWTSDGVGYGLVITDISSTDFRSHAVINPYSAVAFEAVIQGVLLDSTKIKGFSINSKDQPKIRFGYEKLGWWDRLRWFLAEELHK